MALHGDPARGDHVDGDPEGGQLARHAPRPAGLAPLGGHVGREGMHAEVKDLAGDVDQPAMLARLHRRQGPPSQQVGALHKEVEHLLIEVPVVVFDCCVGLVGRGVDHHDVDWS